MSSLVKNQSSPQINFKKLIKKLIMKMNRELDKNQEEAAYHLNRGALACFTTLCNTLSINNRVIEVNLSGCNINVYYAIEISGLIQKNTNIQILNLGSCLINSFGLSCIFRALIDHSGLKILNLFNNQAFTTAIVQDFCRYVLCGKNQLQEINLSHCNIQNSLLAQIMDKTHHLSSLRRLKLSLMSLNSEGIFALSSMMLNYTGKLNLDYLDISYNQIKNEGIELLAKGLFMSVRLIKIKSLNLNGNHISQTEFLEQIIMKIQLEELHLAHNQLVEFQNQQVLNLKLLRIDLSHNRIEEIPNNFFLNVFYLNLSSNQINTEGAYQISQVLSSNKVRWMYLDLTNNKIKTKGFISIIYALIENTSLTSLSVSKNQITGEGILVYIFNHEQIRLQYLDLSHNQLRYDLVYALISMMKESRLKSLILSQLFNDENEIQSGKQDCFEIKCTNLKELDFSSNPSIMQPILESLCKQYNRLEYLNLNACGLNQSILIEKLSILIEKTYTLTTLQIAQNHLGSLNQQSLDQLSSSLGKNSTLRNLNLSSNKLKDSIQFLINGLQNCCSLRNLNISNNLIDENEMIAKKLPLIFKNRSLQIVDLSSNWIHGKTLQNIKYCIQKMHSQFPQLILNNLKLTADDLLILSDIISDISSFKVLDISLNDSIDYMNNFTALQDHKEVKSLTINKIQCRLESYQFLQQIIKQNQNSLSVIEVSNTLISQNYLLTLLHGMTYSKHLKSFILEYQLIESREILEAFSTLIQIKALDNLQHLIIKKSTLSLDFFMVLKQLLQQTEQLQELDISENRINQRKFEILCQGISINNSLITLNLSNIKLDDFKCKLLIESLYKNRTIQNLELSRNNLTQQSYYNFFEVFNNNISQLQKLKFSKTKKQSLIRTLPEYKYDFLINFDLPEQSRFLFCNLIQLDLTRVKYQLTSLKQLINRIKPDQIFQNVVVVIFNECQFEDEHCELLLELLIHQIKLQELSLTTNNITSKGFNTLINFILENKSHLRKLVISNNCIDSYILSKRCLKRLTHFNLLIIDNNKALGNQDLIDFLKINPGLYIYNTWTQATEELAFQIIEQYIQYSINYNIKMTPFYLKSLIIRDSNLTDNFLIWFGSKYFHFQYLESIDFSGSTKYSTSVGKMHMYISMINEQFMNYNLIDGKIDNEQRVINIFDDGILQCSLIKLKNYFLRNGSNGKWMIQLINTNQYQYTEFKLSSSLYRFLRQNKFQIKTYCFIQFFSVPIKAILSAIIGFYFEHLVDPKQVNINCKNMNPCYFTNLNIYIIGVSIAYMIITLFIQMLSFYVAIKIRVKAVPDYCIRTFEEKQSQMYRYPLRHELMLFFIQFFIQTDYFFEFEVIGFCGSFIKFLQEQNIQKELQFKFFVLLFALSSITIIKFIIVTYTNYNNMYNLFKNLDSDQATFFSHIWKMSEKNYVLESVLRQFCPQIGIQIKKYLLNSRQISEFILALLIYLPSIICMTIYFNLSSQYFESQYESIIIPSAYFVFLIGQIRVIFGFFFHLNIALTSRPPQVNGFDLNHTLLQRKYQQFYKEQDKYKNLDVHQETNLISLANSKKWKNEKKFFIKQNKIEF
ncbi:unnamed protein product (macronuclear) [Paramecium tetraurelia]|uniref:Transmembrane protein n=1 Tax=Paramecium tetraurelia TaxID=5888 RepID=A0CE50_PARTE|nr:uncharacterized protein GSPATT00037503001 [Paramecium tetraurelia]CAK69067.1 unnamed protein product [Paramecium tetraurelia]|eukprot:XP_001436464.1 hypothetical protein (macronuclear) [Paramecium tetraurelia strain d4-2]